MIVRIHWIYDHAGSATGEDSLVITGSDFEDVKAKVAKECERRGINENKNDIWSEVLEE